MSHSLSFSRGFDRGNYGNAYESQDWDSWYSEQADKIPSDLDRTEYQEGLILGFFSSYEVSELPDPSLAETVQELRSKHGED